MFREISASDVANAMSMMRSAFKGTFLVVEGITDCRLYQRFADDGVNIIIAHSKDNVRRSVLESQKGKERNVIGIVDKDIDGMLGKRKMPPVFETDRHDMESSILCSHALDDILAEFGDRERLDSFEKVHGNVGNAIARAVAPIGLLMYISYRKGMNLSFKDLDHSVFINRKTLDIDIPMMVTCIYSQSMGQIYSKEAIIDQIRNMQKELQNPWDAVRGHDAVAVLDIGLRNTFGSYNASHLSEGKLGGALRLAYSLQYFKRTSLYTESDAYAEKKGLTLWIRRRSPRNPLSSRRWRF